MSNIYFGSDFHYHHCNLIRGTSQWTNKARCRNFDTIEEHDSVLVDNINSTVKENDILYHLGDWAFGGKEKIVEFRRRLYVKDIRLILGNHDHHIEKSLYNDLFTSVDHYKRTTINKQMFVMCHFPMRVWDKSHHGSIMLHGHCHGTLSGYKDEEQSFYNMKDIFYKTMDVGIDTHPEFRPYHIDEILDIMKDRINLNVDHHGPETN
jgi:calcineurin-like phosphoesterase family protein